MRTMLVSIALFTLIYEPIVAQDADPDARQRQ